MSNPITTIPFYDLNPKPPTTHTHIMPPRDTGRQKVSNADKQKVSEAEKQGLSGADKQKAPDAEKQELSIADNPELSDTDAEADEWDDAEYARQMKASLMQVYSPMHRDLVREECKKRDLRIWGHKHVMVERIVNHDVEKAFAWGAQEAAGGEEASGGKEAYGGEKVSGGEEASSGEKK